MSEAFERYIAPARARAGAWRVLLGLALIAGCWVGWVFLMMAAFVGLRMLAGADLAGGAAELGAFLESRGPGPAIFQFATFVGIWPGVWLALRLLHGQPFATLISPERRMRWDDFFRGMALSAIMWAPTLAAAVIFVGWPERTSLDLSSWLLTLAPLALVVALQASAEELVFRGYLLQQLAVRFRSPLVWAVLPALLFGLAHYANGASIGVGLQYVLATTLFGAVAAAVVWRTGSLSGAMGLHTGMNLLALAGISVEGVIEGTQLFLYRSENAELLFYVDKAATLALLALVLSPLSPFRARPTAAAA